MRGLSLRVRGANLNSRTNMIYLSHEEIQSELFSLLCDFDDFANSLGLRYTLLGGTLLGAVRHKGFIPWDDDLDVGMPRPDYETFLAHAQVTPEGCAISSLSKEYPLPFAKFGRKGIVCRRAVADFVDLLWVDVFPLDGMPEDEMVWQDQYRRFRHERWNLERRHGITSVRWKRPLSNLKKRVLEMVEPSVSFGKKIDAIAQEYPFGSTTKCRDTAWNPSPTIFFRTDDFDDLICLEFCGREFPAVKHWDENLTSQYGDYMTLPPEEEQRGHGIMAYRVEG